MASIDIAHDHLHVHLKLYEKVLAWHSSLSVPLVHIIEAHAGADIPSGVGDDARFRGTYIPGRVIEGTQTLPNKKKCFIDVHDASKAVTIQLSHDEYSSIVIEMDGGDPAVVAGQINDAVKKVKHRMGMDKAE